ncbi:MAG: sulfatase-like hydrolase/transferase [Phycisphaerae bacterium]|nr:sulfatase-like hydrolase/transferase [Phycisphaerae bacterium]
MRKPAHTRRDFLKLVGTGAAALALSKRGDAAVEPTQGKPNVLVILVDDLGYGDLSSYGATDLKSPNIDGLVAAGMRFDSFYANCPVCSPTRAALLTGRYPDLVGVPGVIRTHITDNWGYLLPQAVLLPQMLKRAGYHTALVGKWHLGLTAPNTPNERGFDHFHGFLGDMMDDYYTHRRHGLNYMRLNDKEIDPEGHATDLFTQWAIDYLRERSGKARVEGVPPSDRGQDARDTRQPFFLYLAYNAPHVPIQPPQERLDRVKQRQNGIDDRRAKLVALIEHLDAGIGKVLAALKETGLDDNTLVIFTSDNGGQLSAGATNGPLRASKGDMYEGGIREPMCAVWPGRIEPGSRSSRVALTMDVFPTACAAAGVRIEHEIDGHSILPTLTGERLEAGGRRRETPTPAAAEDRVLFWVRREGGPQYGGRAYYAARQGDFKLLQNSPFEPMELYNLKDDPKEQKPLGRKHPMYNKLFTALQGHITQAGAVPWQRYPVNLDQPLTH